VQKVARSDSQTIITLDNLQTVQHFGRSVQKVARSDSQTTITLDDLQTVQHFGRSVQKVARSDNHTTITLDDLQTVQHFGRLQTHPCSASLRHNSRIGRRAVSLVHALVFSLTRLHPASRRCIFLHSFRIQSIIMFNLFHHSRYSRFLWRLKPKVNEGVIEKLLSGVMFMAVFLQLFRKACLT